MEVSHGGHDELFVVHGGADHGAVRGVRGADQAKDGGAAGKVGGRGLDRVHGGAGTGREDARAAAVERVLQGGGRGGAG